MIKSIHIKNFGKHKELKLNGFSPGLNIFIGKTNQGKTSIFRALRLIAHNEPKGGIKLFTRDKSKKLSIEIETDNCTISRTKKEYKLKKGKKELIFKAFGKGVPEPISELLNFKEINWQLQNDPHFLIFRNGGDVAKYLNKVFGTEESERIIKVIKEKLSTIKTEQKFLIKDINEQRNIINQYQNLEDHNNLAKVCKKHYEHLQGTDIILFSISDIVKQVEEIDEIPYDLKSINEYINRVKELEQLLTENNNLEEKINGLKEIIDKLGEAEVLYNISMENHLNTLNDLNTKSDKQLQLKQSIESLESIFFDLENCEAQIELLDDKIETLEQEIKSIGKCPYCGSKLK